MTMLILTRVTLIGRCQSSEAQGHRLHYRGFFGRPPQFSKEVRS